MNLLRALLQAIKRMFRKETIETKLPVSVALPDRVASQIDLWMKMYRNHPPWRYDRAGHEICRSLNIGSVVAGEVARMVTLEFESEVGDRTIDEVYQRVVRDLRGICERAAAGGGLAFKVYMDGEDVAVDYVTADQFYPTSYSVNGDVTGAVFVSRIVRGKSLYTKLEYQRMEKGALVTENTCYRYDTDDPENASELGRQVDLSEVEEWADIEPSVRIEDIDAPLFAYFRMPGVNRIDLTCPLGASCYAPAVDQIREADRQYERILWEFEGKEAAIFADEGMFRRVKTGAADAKGNPVYGFEVPKGRERLFRLLRFGPDSKDQMREYSPEIRDASLYHGLNEILKRVEFNCGLSYGTISDPQQVDKTATEIISSKQRMYSTIKDIQKALEEALRQLVRIIANWYLLSGTSVNPDPDISFKWDDSIVVDKDTELKEMRADVQAGFIRPEIYVAKKYGVSEEEALLMMPRAEEGDGEIEGASSPFGTLNR